MTLKLTTTFLVSMMAGPFFAGSLFAQDIKNPDYVTYPEPSLIQRDMDDFGWVLRLNYDKFIAYKTPNGGSIQLVATNDVSDEQLLRAYNILDFYLTDAPNTRFGNDKTTVANTMADNGATLVLPGGADGNSPVWSWALQGQPLYELEFPIEGSVAYITNDYEQRDAGFEEIFHLVHDYGIGTRYSKGALSHSFQVEFAAATQAALDAEIWGYGSKAHDWIKELRDEGSLQQEYAAAIIDSYYGYWGAWTEEPGGMWNIYKAKTRADVERIDPAGIGLIREFLPEFITYIARIDPEFEGTFEMQFNEKIPYTHKSQYLLNARLLGTRSSNLNGNAENNILMGNKADNVIDGRAGDDVVQFDVLSTEVSIFRNQKGIRVIGTDTGNDLLWNIEVLRFKDIDIPALDIQ